MVFDAQSLMQFCNDMNTALYLENKSELDAFAFAIETLQQDSENENNS